METNKTGFGIREPIPCELKLTKAVLSELIWSGFLFKTFVPFVSVGEGASGFQINAITNAELIMPSGISRRAKFVYIIEWVSG